ncbi:MAG: NYN domain-containing protein [Defluviitaleaceae bacterium]|nr:NYN domain-containing protein [Defluviitaleaceae bacterium]
MKTAIFYDLENIGFGIKNGKYEAEFENLLKRIKSSELVGEIILQKAYMRKTPHFNYINEILSKYGIELVAVESFSNNTQKKANMVDFKMGIDATSIIGRKRSIETVVVASGDSDFGFLCQYIKDMGKNLMVVSRFSITGEVLFKLCDDWLDLSPIPSKPKFINKALDARIKKDYRGQEFLSSFNDLLKMMNENLFIRRYMVDFGLAFNEFISLLSKCNIKQPNPKDLGFENKISMIDILLNGTKFELKGGIVKYNPQKTFGEQISILDRIIAPPKEYCREKLLLYHDILKEVENVDEMLVYIEFMKKTGMLHNNTLCPKRTFRASIRKHLRQTFARWGINLDEKSIQKFVKKL